MNIWSKSCGL